jgi:dephospho-CoA kinase
LKLIGLTGGAGSGKSTVSALLKKQGAAVIDADEAAHAAYEPGSPGFEAVVREFGPEFVRDKDARRRLNAIVHPLVREWMAARTLEAAEGGAEVVVQDVPLLYENGLDRLYSTIVLVYVPESLQLKRLVEGRGVTQERARAMIAAQMPIEEKRTFAPHVIDNSGSREATRTQVERLWRDSLASR